MALIFLGVLIVFAISSFEFHNVLTSSLMMSGPNSPNLNPLDYQVCGNAGVSKQAVAEAKTSCWVLKCTLVNLVCVTRESYWQCGETLLQATADMCVSQRSTFEHLMWYFIQQILTVIFNWISFNVTCIFNEKLINFVIN